MFWLILVLICAGFSSAHLEAGFDKDFGPYLLDVGWDPVAPNVGQSTAFAVNVVHEKGVVAASANVSSVWIRFSRQDKVWFAGNVALKDGNSAFTYSFPETGSWIMEIKVGPYTEKTEIVVPGKAPTTESTAWLIAGVLAVAMGLLLLKKTK